jgi:hypothetical protein
MAGSSGGTSRTTRSGHISDMSVSWSVHLIEVAAGGLFPLSFASFCCCQPIRLDLWDQIYLVLKILLSSSGKVIVFTPGPIFLDIRPLVGLMISYHNGAIGERTGILPLVFFLFAVVRVDFC